MNQERATILRGARVVDPVAGTDSCRDLAIADGMLVDLESVTGATVVDLGGLVVAPGFVDLHTHLRDPGQVHKEDIASGTRAAAAGGFTTVVAMPNTTPAIDSPEMLAQTLAAIHACARVRVLPTAALSVGRQGQQLTDAGALKRAGAAALTDDGNCMQDTGLMLRAVLNAASAGIPVIDHCEDRNLAQGGAMHAGDTAQRLGLPGLPALAEEIMVARDALIARTVHHSIHVQHISSAGAVDLVRWARQHGSWLSAEACPHHLFLTDTACAVHGANAKMNPPLRTEADRQALLAAVCDGTISVIATDHAPHTAMEKNVPFTHAPFGIVGLETAVPLCLTHLYHTGLLSLPDLVARLTLGPRHVLGLPAGALQPGMPADLVVLDVDAEHVIDSNAFRSRSHNTPFHGCKCRGRPLATIVAGRCVFSLLSGLPEMV